MDFLRLINRAVHRVASLLRRAGEYLFQRTLPGGEHLVQRNLRLAEYEDRRFGHRSQFFVCCAKLLQPVSGNLRHDVADSIFKQIGKLYILSEGHAEMIAEGHLRKGGRRSSAVQGIGGNDRALADQFRNSAVQLLRFLVYRQIVVVPLQTEAHQLIAGDLQFRRDHMGALFHIHRKGNQSGRHIDIVESSGHGILAADGRKAVSQLRVEGAEQRREGLAPALRFLRHPAEVFLEGEADLRMISARRHDSGDGFRHRIHRSMVRAPGGQVRVEAAAHEGHRIRFSFQNGKLRRHHLRLGELIFSAVGHQHAARADGGVEHLHQSLLGADVQIGKQRKPCLLRVSRFHGLSRRRNGPGIKIAGTLFRHLHVYIRLLMRAVGIQEGSGQVHDLLSSPGKHQSGLFGHLGHAHRFQILLRRIAKEGVHILRVHHHGHSLLGFGDGKLRAVQTRVLFGYLIQIHPQAVRQLADGNGYAARAEVVALLDQPAHLSTAEQSLDLSFRRRISLLYLCAAGLDARLRVHLGGAGRTAAAVPSGPSAEQNDDIARIRGGTHHVFAGSRSHHRTDFHSLCHIVGMINFLHVSRCKTDLVSVGGIAVRSAAHQLFLGKLSLQSLRHRNRGVRCARHAHGLIHIAASGKGIPDRAAQTGGRAAKGLDLRRMVVGFILEEHQPLFRLRAVPVIHFHRNDDGAGVDFLGFLHVRKLSFLLQPAHTRQSQIHQADELVLSSREKLFSGIQIALISLFDGLAVVAVLKFHIFQLCGEGGMTAVIGPVGIQHPDLRHGRIPVLFPRKIVLNMLKIPEGHRQSQRIVQRLQLRFRKMRKAVQNLYVRRLLINGFQRIRLHHARLSGIHRVDAVRLDLLEFLIGEASRDQIGGRRADDGIFLLVQKFHTLHRGIRPLVKLSRQIFHGKDASVFRNRNFLPIQLVHRRLRKHRPARAFKHLVADVLHIIPDENPNILNRFQIQVIFQISLQLLRLHGKRGLLLHIDTPYVSHRCSSVFYLV